VDLSTADLSFLDRVLKEIAFEDLENEEVDDQKKTK
jgi:hypothetical protein